MQRFEKVLRSEIRATLQFLKLEGDSEPTPLNFSRNLEGNWCQPPQDYISFGPILTIFYARHFSSRFFKDRRGDRRLGINSAADTGKRGELLEQKSATPIIIDLFHDGDMYTG